MGAFSNDTIYTASIARVPLVAAENRPNLIKEAVMNAIAQNSSISNSITMEAIAGFQSQVDRYFRFGLIGETSDEDSDEGYIYGLPTGSGKDGAVDDQILKDTIEGEIGEPIVIHSTHIGELLGPFAIYQPFLDLNRQWDTKTNIVHNPPYHPDIIDDYGERLNPPYSNTVNLIFSNVWGVDRSSAKYEFAYRNLAGEWQYPDQLYSEDLVTPGANDVDSDFVQCQYYLASDTEQFPHYWWYKISTGTLPGIIKPPLFENSPYYPVAILRHDKKDLDKDPDTELYKDTKKLLSYVQTDIETTLDAIRENPDQDSIEDVFIGFFIDIQTEDKHGLDFLFRYWLNLSEVLPVGLYEYEQFINSANDKGEYNIYLVSYREVDIKEGDYGSFGMTMQYTYIDVQTYDGTIGFKGYVDSITELKAPQKYHDGTGRTIPLDSLTYEKSIITFRKQITDTSYQTITVHGLQHFSRVFASPDKNTGGTQATLNHSIEYPGSFYIPLERHIVREMGGIEESYIYYDSLCMIIFAVAETDVGWYQTEEFLGFMQIIVLAVSVVTLSPWLNVLYAAYGIGGVIVGVGLLYAAGVVFKLILDWLVEKIGGVFAIILAIIILVIYVAITHDIDVQMWAEMFLKAVSAIVESEQRLIQKEFEELQEDYENFLVESDAKKEIFEEAVESYEDEWGMDIHLDPNIVLRREPMFFANENPTNYFARTLDTAPGQKALDVTSTWVDSMLMLPTIDHVLNA